jgi:hypothetical protein
MAYNTGANTKNDLIIERVQRELLASATMTSRITDFSALAMKGIKSLAVPKLSSFTAVNRTFGNAGTVQELTDSFDSILLDQNSYISWGLDRASEYQSQIQYELMTVERAAAAHGRFVNNHIIAGLIAGAGYDQGAATVITKDIILDMFDYLLGNEARVEDMFLEINAAQHIEMLKIADFVDADKYGSNGNIQSGLIGRVYGVSVIINNLVPATQAIAYSRDGYGYALQQGPQIGEQPDVAYGSQGVRKAMDLVFGSGILQENVNGAGVGKSPLIAKMN